MPTPNLHLGLFSSSAGVFMRPLLLHNYYHLFPMRPTQPSLTPAPCWPSLLSGAPASPLPFLSFSPKWSLPSLPLLSPHPLSPSSLLYPPLRPSIPQVHGCPQVPLRSLNKEFPLSPCTQGPPHHSPSPSLFPSPDLHTPSHNTHSQGLPTPDSSSPHGPLLTPAVPVHSSPILAHHFSSPLHTLPTPPLLTVPSQFSPDPALPPHSRLPHPFPQVDGVRRCLPFALTSGRVRAFARGASVVLAVRGGPRLLFELGGHLSVELPAAYRGLTRGLCGNFNGNASDDLQLQGPGPCAAPRPCPGSGCPPAAEDAGADAAGRGACGLLREPSGPLAPCHALLPPEPFFQACVADVGRARGNREVLCAFLQAYVAACQTAGADMRPWRAPSFCRMFPTRGLSELAGCGAGGGGRGGSPRSGLHS